MFSRFLYFFNRRERLTLVGQLIFIFTASGVEVLSIGLIVPFIAMINSPEIIHKNYILSRLFYYFSFSSNYTFLLASCFFLMGIFIVKNLYLLLIQYLQNRFFEIKTVKLESFLLTSYLSQPYEYYFSHNKSEILNIVLKAVGVFINQFTKPILVVIAETATMLGILGFLIFIEPLPMIVALGSIIFIAIGTLSLMQKKLVNAGRAQYLFQQNTIKWANQSIDSVKENRIFCRLPYFIKNYKGYAYKNAEISIGIGLMRIAPRLLVETFIFIGILGFIAFVMMTKNDTTKLIPMLGLLGVAAMRILPSVTKIINSVVMIKQSHHVVKEIYQQTKLAEKLKLTASKNNTGILFDNEIAIKNVHYSYTKGDKKAVSEISLCIKRGESVALVGASGSGKSTLVDILLGLLKPDTGNILVDGVNINDNIDSWRKKIGYIPQSIYLLDSTLRENIAFGLDKEDINDQKIWDALKIAQLDTFVKSLPNQLDSITGENGVSLSGGQKQRIGIARALYHDPEVLVFDEATSALDNETEKNLADAIDMLAGTKTLIIIAHRMSTVRNCDNIFFLKNGTLVDSGGYKELLDSNMEFRNLTKLANIN